MVFAPASAVADLTSRFCLALADISDLASGLSISSDQRHTKEAQRRHGRVSVSQAKDHY